MSFIKELERQIKKTGLQSVEIARKSGVAPSAVTHLLKGRLRLTVPMAARLEKGVKEMDGLKLLRAQLKEEYPLALKGKCIFKSPRTTSKKKPVAKAKARRSKPGERLKPRK